MRSHGCGDLRSDLAQDVIGFDVSAVWVDRRRDHGG
jgi:hypothetical protein